MLQNIIDNQKAQAKGDFIGSLIWWSLSDNHVDFSTLESYAKAFGYPERYLPNEVTPISAFRRAWKDASKRMSAGLMLRSIGDTPQSIQIALVKEERNTSQSTLDHEQLLAIIFDKKDHTISVDFTAIHKYTATELANHEVVTLVRERYQHHLLLTTEDMRKLITNFVHAKGISLRESGGVYFIPAPEQPTLESMTELVHKVGRNQVVFMPFYDSPQAQAVLSGLAKESIAQDIQRLEEELDQLASDDKTRESTLQRRLELYEDLKSRVATFNMVLEVQADEFNNKIHDLQNKLRTQLGLSPVEKKVLTTEQPRSTVQEEVDTKETSYEGFNEEPDFFSDLQEALDSSELPAVPTGAFVFDDEAGF